MPNDQPDLVCESCGSDRMVLIERNGQAELARVARLRFRNVLRAGTRSCATSRIVSFGTARWVRVLTPGTWNR